MPTPQLIDATAATVAQVGQGNLCRSNCGPIVFGGVTFACTQELTTATNIADIAVYESTDDFATHTKHLAGIPLLFLSSYAYYPGSGSTVWFFSTGSNTTAPITVTTFDLVTKLFTVLSAAGESVNGYLSGGVLSNGDCVVVYFKGTQCLFDVLSGGVWAGELPIGAAAPFQDDFQTQGILGNVVDSHDRLHLMRQVSNGVMVADLIAGGVVVSADVALPSFSAVENSGSHTSGIYTAADDTIRFGVIIGQNPAFVQPSSTADNYAAVVSGTPSAAPVWSISAPWIQSVDVGVDSINVNDFSFLVQFGGDFYLFVQTIIVDNNIHANIGATIAYSRNGAAQQTFWDSRVDGVPVSPFPYDVEMLGVLLITGSTIITMVLHLNHTFPVIGTQNAAYFLRSAAAAPPAVNIVLGLKGMKVYLA